MTVPDPMGPFAPWEPLQRKPSAVSDSPAAVSAAARAASLWGRGEPSPPDAGSVSDTPPEGVTDTLSAGVTDTGTTDTDTAENLPAVAEFGRPMTIAEQATGIARQRITQVRADIMRPGELAHALLHGKPESIAEIHDYAVHRLWLDGHPGGKRDALNVLYLHTVAKGGTAFLLGAMWVIQRFTRLMVFLFACGVLVGIAFIFG